MLPSQDLFPVWGWLQWTCDLFLSKFTNHNPMDIWCQRRWIWWEHPDAMFLSLSLVLGIYTKASMKRSYGRVHPYDIIIWFTFIMSGYMKTDRVCPLIFQHHLCCIFESACRSDLTTEYLPHNYSFEQNHWKSRMIPVLHIEWCRRWQKRMRGCFLTHLSSQ